MKENDRAASRRSFRDPDLDALLHPARAFVHPSHVVDDPDLTLNEKRAILASWASDVCAIEAAPALRQAPGAMHPVRFDDLMDALRALDRSTDGRFEPPRRYRLVLENRVPGMFRRKSRAQGANRRRPSINWSDRSSSRLRFFNPTEKGRYRC